MQLNTHATTKGICAATSLRLHSCWCMGISPSVQGETQATSTPRKYMGAACIEQPLISRISWPVLKGPSAASSRRHMRSLLQRSPTTAISTAVDQISSGDVLRALCPRRIAGSPSYQVGGVLQLIQKLWSHFGAPNAVESSRARRRFGGHSPLSKVCWVWVQTPRQH